MMGLHLAYPVSPTARPAAHCELPENGHHHVPSGPSPRQRFVTRSPVRDGVVVVTLRRPERRNAVGPDLAADLEHAMRRLDGDPRVRAAVLAGAGASFCAGADMKERRSGSEGSAAVFGAVRRSSAVVGAVSVPVIAAVHGHALGAGLELAAMCDYRIVEEGTLLGLPEVAQGITSGGGLLALASLAPRGVLARLAFTGAPLDAATACSLGLADELVPAGRALDVARSLARQVAERPRAALVAAKQALRIVTQPLFPQQWDSLGHLQRTLEGGPAQQEALARLAGGAGAAGP